MNPTTPPVEKSQALAMLEQGIVCLNTFTYQDATCEAFAAWRAQMLQTLIMLMGEHALPVFEWRVMRFVPTGGQDAEVVWKSSQNYARHLLSKVQMKQQKL